MTDKEETLREYEIAFLLKEEGDLEALKGLLKQHGATFSFESPLKKVALAYKIEKQEVAHFGFLRFTAPADQIPILEHALTLHHTVLRSLVVKYVPVEVSTSQGITPHDSTSETPISSSQQSAPSQSNLPLSNEDLEKKIEEILK